MRKKPASLIASRLAGLLVLVVGLGLAQLVPVAAQDVQLVQVAPVKKEPLRQTVPVIGRLVSLRSGEIAARIGGPVEAIMAEVGDRVTKGQIIAMIDAEALVADEQMAQSELAEAQAEHATWAAEAALARTDLKRQEGLRRLFCVPTPTP